MSSPWHLPRFVTDARDIAGAVMSAQSHASGPGQGDVAGLLRRVADSIDVLGEVQVEDSRSPTTTLTAEEDDLTVNNYYNRQPRCA